MANLDLARAGAVAAHPSFGPASFGFGGRGHRSQMQGGYDFSQSSPEDIALQLGLPGYGPAYDSNQKGSFERAYNDLLGRLTPDLLVKRYGSVAPEFSGRTSLDLQNQQAYNSFKSIVGRDPTGAELAQILPIFHGPNGQELGNAYLAQFAEQEKQRPENLRKNAPQYANQVGQTIKSILGRDATPDELEHFGSLFATGNLDSYQLQDFLRGTPEFQTAQDKQFREGLSKELQGTDLNFFNRAQQGLRSQFAQQGQYLGQSSALDSALTDLMGQIADKRSEYLAGLSSQQYQGNKNLALGNYENQMNQFLGEKNYQRGRSTSLEDYYRGRSDDLSDYQRQMNDYMNYMNQNNQRGGLGAALGGALGGAGALAPTRNPWAIGAGALGGGLFGYFNR